MKKLLFLFLLLMLAPFASAQDWILYPGLATETATGTTYKVGGRGELDFAIERSDTQGSVIECNGEIPGVSLGIGENYRNYEVVRGDPIRVTLTAGPDHVSVGPIAWGQKKDAGGEDGLAIEYLELNGITVDGRFAQSPLGGHMDTRFGDIVFMNVTLLSTKSKTKWGSRIQGHARSLTAIGCVFLGGGIEHAFYWDHPELFTWFEGNLAQDWQRTMFQSVTRKKPGSAGITRAPATGNLDIIGNRAKDCGAHGGHNFTVTGWPNGRVRFKDNRGESKHACGLFVTYRDPKQGDLLTADGFQVDRLIVMDNMGRYPNGDRDVIGIGNVNEVEVKGGNLWAGTIIAAKAAYNLAWIHSGVQQDNGSVVLDSRESPNAWNLHTGQGPFREGKATLSAAKVDSMWEQAEEEFEPAGDE